MAIRLRRSFLQIVAVVAATSCRAKSEEQAGQAKAELAQCAPVRIERDAAACETHLELPCGLPKTAKLTGCAPDLITCRDTCKTKTLLHCELSETSCKGGAMIPGAPVLLECSSCPGSSGRRPLGLVEWSPRGTLGAHFAAMAYLESASVRAFRDLARRLGAHGAPSRLIRGARVAAMDERRHARAAARLARLFGGATTRPRVRHVPEPTLTTLLEDNAIEGCVGETYGALLATYQATHATDPRVARTMGGIARDETRHAELAWEIFAWGAPRVDVRRKIDRALVALRKRIEARAAGGAVKPIGAPSRDVELLLVRELERLVRRLPKERKRR